MMVPKSTGASLFLLFTRPASCQGFKIRPVGKGLPNTSLHRLYSTASTSLSDGRSLHDLISTAEQAARSAGTIIRETAGNIAISKTKANTKDLVTASDVKCQQVIEDLIRQAYPQDLFLGEEHVESGSDASIQALQNALQSNQQSPSSLLWIVDPIDGTTNFQAGLPLCCVSIGVVGRTQPDDGMMEPQILAGVIYNPILDEMVTATQGGGAYVNGRRIVTSNSHVSLSESLINVGFPVVKESSLVASSKAVMALSTKCRGLRMIACASQLMSWVAQDKFQSYISWDLNSWDLAAGVLIVQEAGGYIFDFEHGRPATISSRDLVVTSPSGSNPLGHEIFAILRDNDCLNY